MRASKKPNPPRLYVFADEGRTPEEKERIKCNKDRIAEIDWCEVLTNYASENLGPKQRLSSGINWVFEHEESAIIFEDDCLPDPTFFSFCNELLERYKDDERVMHIGGDNFFKTLGVKYESSDSYFFTHVPHVWGWATWRRAWQHYDVQMAKWPEARDRKLLYNIFDDNAAAYRWENRFQEYFEGRIESWDGQWTFAILSQDGLCINPNASLVTNVGFGPDAFTCKDPNDPRAFLPLEHMSFPLKHPSFITIDREAERKTQRYVFQVNDSQWKRFKWFLKRTFPRAYSKSKRLFRRPEDALQFSA